MRPAGAEHPVALLLLILLVSVGLPFFAVSTTALLLQRWHSRQSSSLDRTYRLYALSNAGSLLALLSYPFGVERLLDLPQQGRVWAAMFTAFAAACAVIVWRVASVPDPSDPATRASDTADESRSSAGTTAMIAWLFLSFTLTLERELAGGGSQRFDLLVMDAISSDAVPLAGSARRRA